MERNIKSPPRSLNSNCRLRMTEEPPRREPMGFVLGQTDLSVHLLIPRPPLPIFQYSETRRE
ncbi:hypothetical protein EYF80_052352 [Liparis tanakae]|uniref:Uncharacterized protein n=1 Tax=Liparis tanakae TaxID=230148 RepID=A0A4Z2F9J4_9TELE|nr:hypothetical protein EYF80_052352 [Liparis tanakae]